MRGSRVALAAGFLVLASRLPAGAQEQTVIVAQPLKSCSAVGNPLSLTEAEAETLIEQALGVKLKKEEQSRKVEPEKGDDTYYILHVVKYVDGRMVVESQDWYVYFSGWKGKPGLWARLQDPRIKKHFEEPRIYGSPHVAMVYLHMNVATVGGAEAVAATFDTFLAKAKLEHQTDAAAAARSIVNLGQRLPQEVVARAEGAAKPAQLDSDGKEIPPEVRQLAHLRAEEYVLAVTQGDKEVNSELTLVDRKTGQPLVRLSETLLTTNDYGQLASLTYKIAITKKVPAPVQNLKSVVDLIQGQSGPVRLGMDVKTRQSLCAGQQLHVDVLPSDMAVTATTMASDGKTEKELGKQTFDNERKYNWDVSLALPLESHTDLTLDSSGGQVTAKKVEKADLFAVLNLSPWAYDTKKAHFQALPVFMYGMPITGKPLQHHLVAAGFGLNKLQIFVGVRFDQIEVASTAEENGVTTGTVAPPAEGKKWESEFVWGINLPVKTVVELLKPKKK